MKKNFNDELQMITGGRSNVETPQFPGQQKGYSIEQVRQLIKKQKRLKGYTHTLPTGAGAEFNIDISGTARIFLGFALLLEDTNFPDTFKLQVNNEVIVDQCDPRFLSTEFMDDEYYFIPRLLSGTDDIKVTYQNTADANTVKMVVYYI